MEFKGTLVQGVCTVDVNHSGQDTGNVDLGGMDTESMNEGLISAPVTFSIVVKGCPTGYDNYQIAFSGVDYNSTGNFAVLRDADDDLVIQIRDKDLQKVIPNTPISFKTPGELEDIYLSYTAVLHSEHGTTKPGRFTVASNIDISYD